MSSTGVESSTLEELRAVLSEQSIRRGRFTLASGATSHYYCDTKATILSPRGALLCGQALFDLLRSYDVEAVGGLAMGATYLATAVALISEQRGQPIAGFVVRSSRKDHGTEDQVDAAWHPDGRPLLSPQRRVAIVDDVITSGGSVLRAVDAAEKEGCDIRIVAAVVDRQAGGARRIRDRGLDFACLFDCDENGELTANARP